MTIGIGRKHKNEYKFFRTGMKQLEIRAESREEAIKEYASRLRMGYTDVLAEMLAGRVIAAERPYRFSRWHIIKSSEVAASYLARFFIERDEHEILDGHGSDVKQRHELNCQLPDDPQMLHAALYDRLKARTKDEIAAIFHSVMNKSHPMSREGMEHAVAYEMAARAANIRHSEIPYYLAQAEARTPKMSDDELKRHFLHVQKRRSARQHNVAA